MRHSRIAAHHAAFHGWHYGTTTSHDQHMKLILLASASLLLSQLSQAGPIEIQNSSFEEPVTADYVSINSGLPAWDAPAQVNTYVVRSGQLTTIGGVTGSQSLFSSPRPMVIRMYCRIRARPS